MEVLHIRVGKSVLALSLSVIFPMCKGQTCAAEDILYLWGKKTRQFRDMILKVLNCKQSSSFSRHTMKGRDGIHRPTPSTHQNVFAAPNKDIISTQTCID